MVQEGCRVAVVVRASVHSLATHDDVGARRASAACGATRPGVRNENPRRAAAIGGAHRVVSRFAGGANPLRCHVSGTGSRGRPMGASASRFKELSSGAGGGPDELGSQCEGAHCVSFRAGQHGQEHFMDKSARRRLLQPAARRDGCRASDAAEGGAGGKPEDYSATCGNDAGFDHHYSTRGAGCCLRACVQSVDSVRATDRGVAGMVSISGHLVWRVRLELGSESDFSGVLVGAGRTGGLTGTTAMSSTPTTGTTRIARPFT